MTIIEFLSQLELGEKIAGAAGAIIALLIGTQRYKTFWKRDDVENSKIGVEKTLIDSLHEEFIRINNELESARMRQNEMNQLVHDQALKLGRMEMMILRMYNLLTHNEVAIPDDLKDHMANIFKDKDNE
jgi:hypothetical protein